MIPEMHRKTTFVTYSGYYFSVQVSSQWVSERMVIIAKLNHTSIEISAIKSQYQASEISEIL